MEFSYKTPPTRKYLKIYGIMAIVLVAINIWDIFVTGFILHSFISQLLLPLAFVSITFIWLVKHYSRFSGDIIRLDDDGIYQVSGSLTIEIRWNEVLKVEWDKTQIMIKSKDKVINVSDHISKFDVIINFIKLHVGERFNTWDIPWELKNPKKNH